MYLSHFSLTEKPFSITPDTGFFMNRAGHQDALNVLLVALRSGEGFIKVVGEVGVGKTLLCRMLLKALGKDYVSAYIHNPYLQPDTLLMAIADALAVKFENDASQYALQRGITRKLVDYHREGRKVVLCLDEVQAMPVQTLETLRLLTNLETEKRKLLQVVLFGQPELNDLLDSPAVRQLKQRITFSCHLQPMNTVAMSAYVRHRLSVAGSSRKDLFSAKAMACLHRYSGGIPRLVNILCHKAMMVAYGEGELSVSLKHMRLAVRDTVESQAMGRPKFSLRLPSLGRWVFGSLCLAAILLSVQIMSLPGYLG